MEPIVKQKERKAAWRYNEDGTYNSKPISESYFRDYYREKLGIKVQCPLCGRTCVKEKLKRHQKSRRCNRPDMTQAQWDYIKSHIDDSDPESPESETFLEDLKNDTLKYVNRMPPNIQEFFYQAVPALAR